MSYAGDMPARPNEQKDEPVKMPLDPEEALRALLQVKPDEEESEGAGVSRVRDTPT